MSNLDEVLTQLESEFQLPAALRTHAEREGAAVSELRD